MSNIEKLHNSTSKYLKIKKKSFKCQIGRLHAKYENVHTLTAVKHWNVNRSKVWPLNIKYEEVTDDYSVMKGVKDEENLFPWCDSCQNFLMHTRFEIVRKYRNLTFFYGN